MTVRSKDTLVEIRRRFRKVFPLLTMRGKTLLDKSHRYLHRANNEWPGIHGNFSATCCACQPLIDLEAKLDLMPIFDPCKGEPFWIKSYPLTGRHYRDGRPSHQRKRCPGTCLARTCSDLLLKFQSILTNDL